MEVRERQNVWNYSKHPVTTILTTFSATQEDGRVSTEIVFCDVTQMLLVAMLSLSSNHVGRENGTLKGTKIS